MRKKILSVLLVFCLLAGCLPLGAGAEEAGLLPLEKAVEQRKESLLEEIRLCQGAAPARDFTKAGNAASVLASYIESHGEVDSDGDRYIEYVYSEDDWSTVTRIFYVPLYNEILFLTAEFFTGYAVSAAMPYDLQTGNAVDGISVVLREEETGTEIEWQCADFNISAYQEGTTLRFISDVAEADTADSQTLCNNSLELSLLLWEATLQEKGVGISMYDLGFVGYFAEPGAYGFVDVKTGDYFYDAVKWAVEESITAGTDTSHFSPDRSCTRGQTVTFLWRAAGEPEPKTADTAFADVKAGSYYEKAVRWAVEEGITAGTSKTKFSPNATCTRAQVVTFLWRAAGEPEPQSISAAFTDVPAGSYYEKAVSWAVENGITAGTSKTKFSPESRCTRGQVVTFLHRYYV